MFVIERHGLGAGETTAKGRRKYCRCGAWLTVHDDAGHVIDNAGDLYHAAEPVARGGRSAGWMVALRGGEFIHCHRCTNESIWRGDQWLQHARPDTRIIGGSTTDHP